MRPYLFAFVLLLGGCAASDTLPVTDTPPVASKMPIADTEIAIQVLRELSADSYEGRAAMTPGNAAAQAWISSQVAEMNDNMRLREHDFTRSVMRRIQQPEDVSGTNLITTLPGRSPDGPILEITAHYDHIGMTENGAIFNGADDNASGVGALFAILKSFLEQPPEHEVRIIWLDAEEGGLNGAREYVRTEIDDRPRLNLNLDMIAQNADGVIYAAGTYHSPELAPLVEQAAKGTGLSVPLGHDRPEDGPNDWTLQSDHAAWHRAGLPFLYLGVEDHPHYHQVTDVFETIPLDTYRKTVQLSVNLAHLLDENLDQFAKVRSTEP